MSETGIFRKVPYHWEAICAYFRKPWLRVIILAIAGLAIHAPSLQGELIWDDQFLAHENPFMRSPLLILEAFRHYLFLDSYSAHYRPVQNLSYMADYFFWNSNLYGFHLSNVLFHVGSGVLLYFLLQKLFPPLFSAFQRKSTGDRDSVASGTSLLAFLVALLWLVHPVHSAAVDYVSGRADSLAFFFACAGWLLFLKARAIQRPLFRHAFFGFALLCGPLSLCSRESACLWVLIFLVYLFSFESAIALRRKCLVLAACLVILSAYAGLRHLPGAREQGGPSANWSAPVRAVLMFRSLGDYGRLMVFPLNLHMERTVIDPAASRSEAGRHNSIELEYLSIVGLLMAAGFAFGALRKGAGQRARIFGATWFVAAYLPISNLIDLNATVAEHWLYLPSVGFLIFLAGVAMDFPIAWRKATVAFACLAVLGLGIRSTLRSSDWMSNEVFAQRTLAAGGTSIRVALLLGQAYATRQQYTEAEKIFRKALVICPDYPPARTNLADVLNRQGKQKEAEALFSTTTREAHETMKEYPRTWMAALSLARLQQANHQDIEALVVLEKAKRDYPQTWELISFEGELLREANNFDASRNSIETFARDNWWHHDSWLALGRLLTEKGEIEKAATALRHASWLDLHETDALNLIALIRLRENKLDEAWRAQRRAVSRQPNEPRQYALLSDILEKMGRNEEARAALAKGSYLRDLAQTPVALN
jgi:protein O-mannosyl-transferase